MKKFADIAIAISILGALLVWIFYPDIPESILGWIALFLIGIPAWLFIEWFGEKVLGSQFIKNSSNGVRILLGIPLVLIVATVAIFVIGFVQKIIQNLGG
jgi:hypothetical protein